MYIGEIYFHREPIKIGEANELFLLCQTSYIFYGDGACEHDARDVCSFSLWNIFLPLNVQGPYILIYIKA